MRARGLRPSPGAAAVASSRWAEPSKAPDAAHHHQVLYGKREAPVDVAALRHVGDTILVIAEGKPVNPNRPVAQWQQADKRFEERGFSRAVWTDDCGSAPLGHLKSNPREACNSVVGA